MGVDVGSINVIPDLFPESLDSGSYRLIYLHPSPRSGEALVIGGLFDVGAIRFFRILDSVYARKILSILYGAQFVEHVSFSLGTLAKRLQAWASGTSSLIVKDEMLSIGSSVSFSSDKPDEFADSILNLASTLSDSSWKNNESGSLVDDRMIAREVRNRIVEHNPFLGGKMFSKKHRAPLGESTIDVPLAGRRILAAPVSFVTKKPDMARMKAEAFLSRFAAMDDAIEQKVKCVYVLAPPLGLPVNYAAIESQFREVEYVGSRLGVRVVRSESASDIAADVLEAEAA